MASLKGNINGIVLTGTWMSEGHTVTFTEHEEEGVEATGPDNG